VTTGGRRIKNWEEIPHEFFQFVERTVCGTSERVDCDSVGTLDLFVGVDFDDEERLFGAGTGGVFEKELRSVVTMLKERCPECYDEVAAREAAERIERVERSEKEDMMAKDGVVCEVIGDASAYSSTNKHDHDHVVFQDAVFNEMDGWLRAQRERYGELMI